MKIIISPAKKMKDTEELFSHRSLPPFLPETQEILNKLQEMSLESLQSLWKCNEALAQLNFRRIQEMDLHKNLCPALFAYEGIQYQNIGVNILETQQLEYLQEHLRILSGFYGVLSPFSAVRSYRLEMQAKLQVGEKKHLYDFWGDKLAKNLDDEVILNLASVEYSKAVQKYLPQNCHFLTCKFGVRKMVKQEEKVVEQATLCKMARGQMLRWMAEEQLENLEHLRDFAQLDFQFQPKLSTDHEFVFIQQQRKTEFDF